MYLLATVLGQDRDASIDALPVEELIEKAYGFVGADIGIVVAEATHAVRGASDIFLVEPGLSVIISVVLTSRAIYQKMKKLHDLRGIYRYPHSAWLHVHCTDMEI
ncbi:hypothetical protein KIW84_035175 [Lathyrus oleraceus]|uniref:Uncharacterized protein n=1 Tax=Pisum sativum TaxID=3888 RepID=A0A9D4Y4W0_PEA|nr:hypothetical protein KIW84_035175 [Pisum sativum]